MLIFGALLRCASPVLTIAAAMGHGRQIFYSPADKRQEAQARTPPAAGCISWCVWAAAHLQDSLAIQ